MGEVVEMAKAEVAEKGDSSKEEIGLDPAALKKSQNRQRNEEVLQSVIDRLLYLFRGRRNGEAEVRKAKA